MFKTSRVPRLLLALMLAVPGVVSAQESCQSASTPVVLQGEQALVFFLGGIPEAGVSLHLVLKDGRAHGAAHITDGTSNTIMISEGLPVLECDDANLDGVAGVAQVLLTMRDARARDTFELLLVPEDGEIDSAEERV